MRRAPTTSATAPRSTRAPQSSAPDVRCRVPTICAGLARRSSSTRPRRPPACSSGAGTRFPTSAGWPKEAATPPGPSAAHLLPCQLWFAASAAKEAPSDPWLCHRNRRSPGLERVAAQRTRRARASGQQRGWALGAGLWHWHRRLAHRLGARRIHRQPAACRALQVVAGRLDRRCGAALLGHRRRQLRRTALLVNPSDPTGGYAAHIVQAITHALWGISNLMHSFGDATEPDFTALVPVYNRVLAISLLILGAVVAFGIVERIFGGQLGLGLAVVPRVVVW